MSYLPRRHDVLEDVQTGERYRVTDVGVNLFGVSTWSLVSLDRRFRMFVISSDDLSGYNLVTVTQVTSTKFPDFPHGSR